MPAKQPPSEPNTTATKTPVDVAASPPVDASPAAYEYTAPFDTVYVAVPLTAHPADGRRPATVYAWPDDPPPDGRWTPTTKKPNQQPDNAPANIEGE